MANWRVHVQGNKLDLRSLEESLHTNDPVIIEDGGEFYLTSKSWEALSNATEVHQRAQKFISSLNPIACFHFNDSTPVAIGGIIRVDADGREHRIIIAEAGAISLSGARVRAIGVALGADQSAQKQEHQIMRLLRLGKQKPVAEDALRFFDKGDWVSLYKVYEIVRDDVRGGTIIERGWLTRKALNNFTQTAQSREALGDGARHASGKYRPPANPMTLKEAKATVKLLLQRWLDSL